MEEHHFDAIAKALANGAASRRRAFERAAAVAVALVLGRGDRAVAQANRCRDEGEECRRGRQCCSGLCKRRACRRAPNQGTCQGQDSCVGPGTDCGGKRGCFCFVTTRGRSYCGAGSSDCAPCARDADCAAAGFPPGTACIKSPPDGCCGSQEGNSCIPPCPD